MSNQRFDVLGIGNAIVDILSWVEEDFLVREGVAKGSMRLIDGDHAEDLYARIGPATEASGGSAANTIVGAASFGIDVAYIGKIANDTLGDFFHHDVRAAKVHYDTSRLENSLPTARSIILITPDGERTMNTYLGACTKLDADDVDPDLVIASGVTFMEGYLWDPESGKNACRKAIDIAQANGRKTSMSLSDSFCVDRYRDDFNSLIKSKKINIVFANEHEAKALYTTADLDTALTALQADSDLAVVTLGDQGCVVLGDGDPIKVPAAHVDKVANLTGAGDMFAAGFLSGLARGKDYYTCGQLGAIGAAEVIGHIGPRPNTSLRGLAEQAGLQF